MVGQRAGKSQRHKMQNALFAMFFFHAMPSYVLLMSKVCKNASAYAMCKNADGHAVVGVFSQQKETMPEGREGKSSGAVEGY